MFNASILTGENMADIEKDKKEFWNLKNEYDMLLIDNQELIFDIADIRRKLKTANERHKEELRKELESLLSMLKASEEKLEDNKYCREFLVKRIVENIKY